ncbi:MAG TPA: amidohydrolase [Castellaniella sp.]|nr:amidohydrolase [Castellaniella sp.]
MTSHPGFIFAHATVITMDRDRRVIEDAAVAVQGDTIVGVGKTDDIQARFPGCPVQDFSHHIIAPGLIDTHVHLSQAMFRAAGERNATSDNFHDWLYRLILPMEGTMTPEDGATSASLCILEMLKSGTTSFLESMTSTNHGFDGIAQVCVDSGIRAALGKVVMDVSPAYRDRVGWPLSAWFEPDQGIAETLAAHQKWDGAANGRIQVWFGCRTADESANPELYRRVAAVAKQHNMHLTIHHSELESDNEFARSQGYRSHMDYAHQLGILGPNSVLTHCTAADSEDIALLASTGTSVSNCPANNAVSAWGPARVVEMLEAGVNVSLGCDGTVSDANMDLLRDLRVLCQVARGVGKSRNALRAETALEMATLHGARALGIADQVGSLEVGKKADLFTVNTDVPHLTPIWNPVATLVFAAQGSDVHTVVIDGKVIVSAGQIMTMDERAILAEVRRRLPEIRRRAQVPADKPRWQTL